MPPTSLREPARESSDAPIQGDAVPAPSETEVSPSVRTGRTSRPGRLLPVDSEEATVHRSGEHLAAWPGGKGHNAGQETRAAYPARDLDAIVLVGTSASCTAPALRLCAEREVTVARLSKQGTLSGYLAPPCPGRLDVRRAQFFASMTPTEARPVARSLVGAALHNQHRRLDRRVSPTSPPALKSAVRRLEDLQEKLPRVRTRTGLRRLKEAADHAYDNARSVLVQRLEASFRFEGPARRAPTDAVSALLMFIDALLQMDVRAACCTAGLDPARGLLHEPGGATPALVRDLMVPFRPTVVDRIVLALLNRGNLDSSHFAGDEGVRLNREGRAAVYNMYMRCREQPVAPNGQDSTVPLVQAFELQARRLARALTRREADFTVFRL